MKSHLRFFASPGLGDVFRLCGPKILVATVSTSRPRWLPQKSLPPYAYLPGKNPHPVRDLAGHSYHVEPIPVSAEGSLGSDAFLWGLDLFNHGYYWEAHEAWEGLWRVADRDGPPRILFKGLILLSAAGVKIREHKNAAAARHAMRAAAMLRLHRVACRWSCASSSPASPGWRHR